MAQYHFSGYVDKQHWKGEVYLSIIEDYRKISGVYPEQIISKTLPDEDGFFEFTGDNLHLDNRIYRIHVDTCSETEKNATHYTGHCPNSEEIIFVANNTDTLSLPFSFDSEMFCTVVSGNEKAQAFIKIDSLKNDMQFAFGSYRSEANRKINSEKWFKTLQSFGEELNEPLAELYIYSFLSDRTNDLHSYYLKDLNENTYYDRLLKRLNTTYPETNYTNQFTKELHSDKYLINPDSEKEKNTNPWLYLVIALLILSLLANLYLILKLKKAATNSPSLESRLTSQEKKILDLILQNKTNKEIASEIFVSVSTVKTHINNLYKKLKVTSRDEVKSLFNK
ncbi:MAG: LuxR C-terminal-related transcriptional regulator [Flavobacteriaceae bacterium]|nr:LuxR C-terminal-related transcriptional regulator [Flavobacteriaceae bacterium]